MWLNVKNLNDTNIGKKLNVILYNLYALHIKNDF